MESTKTATLKVPGATLYYEVRGAGPVLLMICGGIYDAAALAGLGQRLADTYTVVTYDRRGNSRSPLDEPPGPQRVETHADDAHRLLTAVAGDVPADVFGNSSGGQIGLELVARHPEQVRVLVAHEPPIFELLPDRTRWRTLIETVGNTYQAEGVGPAMDRFATAMGMNGGEPGAEEQAEAEPQQAPPPEVVEMLARLEKNTAFFLAYEVPPFSRHTPDLAAVRAATSTRVVLAAGEESAGEPPHRAAFAVAALLHTEPVLLPGGHGGFGTHPEGFAAALRSIFSQA